MPDATEQTTGHTALASAVTIPKVGGPWRFVARRFAANHLALGGLVAIGLLAMVALAAPVLAPYDPTAIERVIQTRYLPPSWSHPFGTDEFGRDVLSRTLYGTRISLSVGVLAMLVAVSVGTIYGAASGYIGGVLDNALHLPPELRQTVKTLFAVR